MNEVWQLGATALAARIRRRELTATAALEAVLARVSAVNPKVNAITAVHAEEARAAAAAADHAVARGLPLGPLHGVPLTVKVNIDTAGWPTTQAVPALAQNIIGVDAPVVAQLRAAGAIPFAATNMPDFGLRWHTDSSLHGVTLNPWDATRVPAGSSGGAAVALATGMGPLALGNDVGGSLRYPAMAGGICSLKPTLGRIARASANQPAELPLSFQLMYTEGPMAREVEDLRTAWRAMSGPDWRDPWWVPAPLDGPPPTWPLRVAVTVDPGGAGVDPQVAAGVRAAADALANAGCAVEEVDPPHVLEACDLWRRILFTETRALMLPMLRQFISPDALRSIEITESFIPTLDREGHAQALAGRTRLLREWLAFMERYPIVIGPVSCAPPFRVGDDLEPSRVRALFDHQRFITALNLLCLPVVVVPVGVGAGLPQAVQIIGQPFREDLCLEVGEMIERARGRITPIDPRG